MSLFDYLKLSTIKLNELNHRKSNWPFKHMVRTDHQTNRDEVAHFCEHDGIRIRFTRARATWQAHAPCALKPWWLFLDPLKKNLTDEVDIKESFSDKENISKRKQERTIK